MEKRCLVTRLASVASDANLPVFNAIRFTIDSQVPLNQNYYTKWSDSAYTKIKIQNGYFVDADGNRHEEIVTSPQIIKAVPNASGSCHLYLMNKEKLTNVIITHPFNLSNLVGCDNLQSITCSKAQGDVAGLANVKLGEIHLSENANVFGDVAAISPTIYQVLSLESAGNKKMTYTKDMRADSSNLAVNVIYPAACFATKEDVENYLIASAKCAFGNRTITLMELSSSLSYSQKAKEAVWYLKNKMYANVGDSKRTPGTYFNITGIDISSITSDPNWED